MKSTKAQPLKHIILCSTLGLSALFASGASQAADDIQLLDSLLQRGLIAQADYDEQVQQLRQTTKNPVLRPLPADQVATSSAASASGNSGDGHDAAGHGGNHFAGAYVVLSNEWKRGSARVDGEKITQSENAPSFGIGYTFAINERYTLGLKATVDLKSGEYGSGEVSTRSGETIVKEKSHYSLAVEPGYVVDDKTLVFGILAYHTAKAEIEDASGSANLSGVGYGLGFKRTIGDHVFVTGELQHVSYGSKTIDGSTVKPSSTTGSVGLGYHF